jgi:hypothetical protein
MFKKAILGFALAASATLVPSTAQATTVYHANSARLYPKGYYYRGGHWHPYRGYGHPYRGGYYDRWGRWHRYY